MAKLKIARKLATHIVHGDPTNNPVGHPIRWAGSWHRKNELELTRIVEINPDAEIDLDEALKVLKAVAPEVDYGEHEANENLQADPDLIYAAMELVPNDGVYQRMPKSGASGMRQSARFTPQPAAIRVGLKPLICGRRSRRNTTRKIPMIDGSICISYPFTRKGAGSIIYWANEIDPDWQDKYWERVIAEAYGSFGKALGKAKIQQKTKTDQTKSETKSEKPAAETRAETEPGETETEAETETASGLFDPWAEYIVPEFPLEILPPMVQEFIVAQSEVIGVDQASMAMCVLGAFSGAIDHASG